MGDSRSLSKSEFVLRIASRAKRYGVDFTQTRLDEWIKQGLALAADAGPSRGRRRTFTYGCWHYRRALQLVRLHAAGINDTDAIFVQLFIRGYGAMPHEVREPLIKEFLKAQAKLIAPLRSVYADRSGEIPPKRKTQFRKQLGEPDKRFKDAGLVIPEDQLIDLIRAARSPNGQSTRLGKTDEVFVFMGTLISGMLARDEEFGSKTVELIRCSNDKQFRRARSIFRSFRPPSNVSKQAAFAFFESLLRREFAAFMLVIALRVAERLENSI